MFLKTISHGISLFFGLIEECFDGMLYRDYVERLEKLCDKIEEFITNQFDFELIHLKEF